MAHTCKVAFAVKNKSPVIRLVITCIFFVVVVVMCRSQANLTTSLQKTPLSEDHGHLCPSQSLEIFFFFFF